MGTSENITLIFEPFEFQQYDLKINCELLEKDVNHKAIHSLSRDVCCVLCKMLQMDTDKQSHL